VRFAEPQIRADGSLDDGRVDSAYAEIATAAELWGLVDAERGARAMRAIRGAAERDGGLPWRYRQDDLREILALLDGDLAAALRDIVDAGGRIAAAHLARVRRLQPHLIESWREGDVEVHSLAAALRAAALGVGYLAWAAAHGVDLVAD
jgi:hypothetical protein